MSALAKPRQRAVRHSVRATIRDGAIVRVKFCEGCGQDKLVTEGPDSEFALNGWKGGRRSWKARCKTCSKPRQRAYRAANSERMRLQARARYHERMAQDPAYRERLRAQSRERKRRVLQDPAYRERVWAQSREWKRRRRAERRDEVNELQRLNYALRRERQGRPVRPSRRPPTMPRVPAELFRAWLETYQRQRDLPSDAALARELCMTERRLRSVLSGQYRNVTLDVVDRALCHAVEVVWVAGHPVVTVDNLYPEESCG